MKKYMLKLKKDVGLTESEKDKYNIKRRFKECEYLLFASDGWYTLCPSMMAYKVRESSEFTQNKIDLIPNGLFKKFDVIEVEEELYNIICPITSNYLLLDEVDNTAFWDNSYYKRDDCGFKKEFTKLEIEKNFKYYANGTFMVKSNSK